MIECPCCLSSTAIQVRNCGFVNCEWKISGNLRQNESSRIYAEGRTFDNKFYTFKECDFDAVWRDLQVKATVLDKRASYNIEAIAIDDSQNSLP
jgi:hypothetical protein